MRKEKLLLIDFRDSFVHNLRGLIESFFSDVSLLDYSVVTESNLNSFDIIVLGPGPGHTTDYNEIVERLRNIVGKVPLLGICLGHQILAELNDLNCMILEEPLHAKAFSLPNCSTFLGLNNLTAQFYNSWSVLPNKENWQDRELVTDLGMVVALRGPNYLGVQFHPESVGTNCPKAVFEKMLSLLYDGHYDHKSVRSL